MGILTEQDQAVCQLSDIPARGKRTIHVNDRTIVLIACGKRLYAVDASQPGMARNLAHGKVLDSILTMPNTGAKYDLATGQCVASGTCWSLPQQRLPMLPVRIENDTVYLRLPTMH